MLDGDVPEDRDVGRLWLLANIGQRFSRLPSEVARALDHDPERIDLICATMLGYAETKVAFDVASGDASKLKAYKESALMIIRRNTFDLHKGRYMHAREHRIEKDPDGCRFCRTEE